MTDVGNRVGAARIRRPAQRGRRHFPPMSHTRYILDNPSALWQWGCPTLGHSGRTIQPDSNRFTAPDPLLKRGCRVFEKNPTDFLIETLPILMLLLRTSSEYPDYTFWNREMQTESATSTGSDPLKAVADALDNAVKATKEGVEKARETATGAMPAAGEFLSQAAYKTCYGISFGVVFPTMLLVRAIPKDNAAIHGLIDGAHAAVDLVKEMKAKSAAGEPH